MGDSRGLERITALVETATKTIKEGQALVETAKGALDKIKKTFDDAVLVVADVEKIGTGNLSDKIKAAMDIVEKIKTIKASIESIYEDGGKIKDSAKTIIDNCKLIIAELQRWREIKKEIEEDLIAMKLEVLKAIKTCWKLASQVYQKASGELDKLLTYIGNFNLSQITVSDIDTIVKEFDRVMTNYDWITWGGEGDVKDLKKAIADSVTASLKKMLKDAADYVLQSKAWQQVQDLEKAILDLRNSISGILTNTEKSQTLKTDQLAKAVDKWTTTITDWVKNSVEGNKAVGTLVEFTAKGFDLVRKFIKAYNMAKDVVKAVDTFPEGLDAFLPHTFSHTFLNKDFKFFNLSLSIPVASLGWISLNLELGLEAGANVKIDGSLTIYNVFKPQEFKIIEGDLTATGSLYVTASAGLSIDLLAIVKAKAAAEVSATLTLNELKTKFALFKKLQGEESKGGLELSAAASLTFDLEGCLSFTVGLTETLCKLVEFFTSKRPEYKWTTKKLKLFTAEFSKSASLMLKFEAIDIDFSNMKKMLKDFAAYRLSSEGRDAVEGNISGKMGSRKQWEEEARGGKLTDQEVAQLRADYGKI